MVGALSDGAHVRSGGFGCFANIVPAVIAAATRGDRSRRDTFYDVVSTPIQSPVAIESYRSVPIVRPRLEEPLVPLGFRGPRIGSLQTHTVPCSSAYFNQHGYSPYGGSLPGSRVTQFVRYGLALRIQRLSQSLPRGLSVVPLDCYRSPVLQRHLYSTFREELERRSPGRSDEWYVAKASQYVMPPSPDPGDPAQHETGGAIDWAIATVPASVQRRLERIDAELRDCSPDTARALALHVERQRIFDERGRVLDVGVPFDHAGEAAGVMYYEQLLLEKGTRMTPRERFALGIYRAMYHLSWLQGIATEPSEIWHGNAVETRKGALSFGRSTASYGVATLSAVNIEFDKTCQQTLKCPVEKTTLQLPMERIVPA